METALAIPLESLAGRARIVSLAKAKDLVRRSYREGGVFEEHQHDDHSGIETDHANHDSHDDHVEVDHTTHQSGNTVHADEIFVAKIDGSLDMHIWLDPTHASQYASNAERFASEMDSLSQELANDLAPLSERPFLVFHDGYRYFEDRYGLTVAGSSVVNPARSPSSKRIRELRQKIDELNVVCVFSEPQFSSRIVNVIVEGTHVALGTLDPLGSSLEDGPDLYGALIRSMGTSFKSCLDPQDHD